MPIRRSVPLMLRYIGSVVILLAVTAPRLAAKTEPNRPYQETFLKRAVFTDGRLWLLSDAGDARVAGVRRSAFVPRGRTGHSRPGYELHVARVDG
jgi:hypothetical protein